MEWGGEGGHRGHMYAMCTGKCHCPLFKVQKLGKIHGDPESCVLALPSARAGGEQQQSWQAPQPAWMSLRFVSFAFGTCSFSVSAAEPVPDPAREGTVLRSSPCRCA